VKHRDLERHLREHGERLLREGGNHSFWGFDAERSSAFRDTARSPTSWSARSVRTSESRRRRAGVETHAGSL
jgi:hypothetical protein